MPQAFASPPLLPLFHDQPASTQALSRSVRHFVIDELGLDVQGASFLLAVSGGADSMALLCLWLWLRPVWKHSLHVLHVDHGLRSQSADEAATVLALCQKYAVPCHVVRVDVANVAREQGLGLEEAARQCRYAALESKRREVGAAWICTGHHAGDLEEDVLMRLIRGAGWPALGGMAACDPERRILRPLLLQNPQELRSLLLAAGMGWAEDASNADTSFTRNRLRHNILPLLKAENPAFTQKIKDMWRLSTYDGAHWDAILQPTLERWNTEKTDSLVLSPDILRAADKATRLRLYASAVRRLAHCPKAGTIEGMGGGQARAQTLMNLDAAWLAGRGGLTFQLPGGICARLRRKSITFSRS